MSGSNAWRPRIVVLVAAGRPVAVFRDPEAAVAWLRDHAAEVEVVYTLVEGVPPEDAAIEAHSVQSRLTQVRPPHGNGSGEPGAGRALRA